MAMTDWNTFLVLVMWIGLVFLAVVAIATWDRQRKFKKLEPYSTYKRWMEWRESLESDRGESTDQPD